MYFEKDNIASPVTNEVTIRIIFLIIIILQLIARVLDIKGAFLQGEFNENEKEIYVKILDGL